MKIKVDFVTNSSSSSFVVIGTRVEIDNIPLDSFQNIKEKVKITAEDITEDPYRYLEPVLEGSDLDHSSGCEYGEGSLMIGIPYTRMKDDETLKQFKERVQKEIKDRLHMDVTPGHIEECWTDN